MYHHMWVRFPALSPKNYFYITTTMFILVIIQCDSGEMKGFEPRTLHLVEYRKSQKSLYQQTVFSESDVYKHNFKEYFFIIIIGTACPQL